jgi:hypothetical protein
MFTTNGVCVDSWARIEGQCLITYDVAGDEAQFRFGGTRSSGINLVVTEEGLANLVHVSTEALRKMRAEAAEQEHAASTEEVEPTNV